MSLHASAFADVYEAAAKNGGRLPKTFTDALAIAVAVDTPRGIAMDQQDWDELARKLGKVADAAPDACGAPCLVADCRRGFHLHKRCR